MRISDWSSDVCSSDLKALANSQRLRILCLLHDNELSVGELNQHVELSQSALSQHLAVLRETALVQTRRHAQTVHYTLVPGPVMALIHTLHGIYCSDSCASCTHISSEERRGGQRCVSTCSSWWPPHH